MNKNKFTFLIAVRKALTKIGYIVILLLEKLLTLILIPFSSTKRQQALLSFMKKLDDSLLTLLSKVSKKSEELDNFVDTVNERVIPIKIVESYKSNLLSAEKAFAIHIKKLLKLLLVAVENARKKLLNSIKKVSLKNLAFWKRKKLNQHLVENQEAISSYVLLDTELSKQSIQEKKRVKSASKAKRESKLFTTCLSFLAGILFTILCVVLPYKFYNWFREIPKPELLAQRTSNAPTRILDRKGRLLYEIYVDRRYDPVPLEKIPDPVIKATLAIEDKDFYFHHGIRLNSIIRAIKANIFGDDLQGASTITQQLVKNTLLSPERTLTRKIKEVILSLLVETKYTKNQILEMYLNNIPYGGTAWGVQSASQKFFGKNASDLNLAEASMLAGLPSAPSVYSPVNGDIELAKQRQKQVLDRMVDLNFINKEDADKAYAEELNYATQSEYIRAPHFVHYVRGQLDKLYGKRYVDFGGLTVTTTLDLDIQDKAQNIVKDEVEASKYLNFTNGAAVVLDNRYRGILAYVGSVDYFLGGYGAFDVTTAYRQPGSSVKPITYALAFEKGFTPASIVEDAPTSFQSYNQTYKPVNYDGTYHGSVTLRTALANSYNIPAVKMVKAVGPDNMVELGHKMGLTGWKIDGSYGLSVTLGGKEVKLLDLANVYSTFASLGLYKETTPFISVKDIYGYEIYDANVRDTIQAASSEASYLITSILSDNSARAPAFGYKNALIVPNHTIAVKTGTTDSKRDNWTFGYTPSYTVGVWVGNNDNTPMNPYLASGLTGAAPIWNKVFSVVLEGTPNEPFAVPNGVFIMVDPACGNKSEVFIKGSKIPKNLCVIDKDKDKDKDKKKKKE